jgi:anti-sigma-K factor RskA
MDYAKPLRADALAAQYVAGTLRGRARARFEALLPGHPALRLAVQAWQVRLMPLTEAVAEVPPPERIWQRIESRLWPPAPAAAPTPWWQRLGLWRALTGTALAGVVALGVLVTTPQPAQPPVIVVLQGTGADAAVAGTIVASVSGDRRALVTHTLQPVSVTAGRVLELWAVPPEAQGGAPRSLGLITANGATVLQRERLPEALTAGGTAALAVSLEPPGGSPTGLPTGPVVFAGAVRL